jgi:hypothetical protein
MAMNRMLVAALAIATTFSAVAAEPAKLLLLGTFHFRDAGLDAAKVEDFDVMAPRPQAYLEALTDRLAAFGPTHVMLEYGPENDEEINERYRRYLAGEYDLGANEIYQLGFRIARKAGLGRVESFDHREVPLQFGPIAEYAEREGSPEFAELQRLIAEFEAEEEKARAGATLESLLRRHNDPELERRNRDLYLLTNVVGAGDGWAGADAATSWWKRNFRMYALLQRAAQPGQRVIAVGGAGHMAIVKGFADTDGRVERVPVTPYLRSPAEG